MRTAPTEETWQYVKCRFCGEQVAIKDLAKHEDECGKQEHPTKDKFE